MIMALIQVTPEVLNSKATEVRNLRSQHDDTMAAALADPCAERDLEGRGTSCVCCKVEYADSFWLL